MGTRKRKKAVTTASSTIAVRMRRKRDGGGKKTYVCDVVGNLALRARCEQYVEDEERAPAENEGEKNESQDLVGDTTEKGGDN